MIFENLFSGDILGRVESAIDQVDQTWQMMPRTPAGPAIGLMERMAANWVGYGVSMADPIAPKIILFVRDLSAIDLSIRSLCALDICGRIEFETGFSFDAIPPAVSPGVSVPEPGAKLVCEASNSPADLQSECGTLGAFLEDDQGRVWILSANHVLAFNRKFQNNSVKLSGSSEVVSQEVQFVPLDESGPNQADAAIARYEHAEEIRPAIPGAKFVLTDPPRMPMARGPVKKVGATTDTTQGSLAYFCPRLKLRIASCGLSEAEFTGQWLVRDSANQPFSAAGDSGSLVLYGELGVFEPLGLLIANRPAVNGHSAYSVVTPFHTVISTLQDCTKLRLRLLVH
jgi:hypothetical protein